jgi:hypothetical protein
MVEYVVQGHGSARVQSVPRLVGVEDSGGLQDEVNAPSDDGSHDLAEGLVQADRSHIIEIRSGRTLRDEADEFVLHPLRGSLGHPEDVEVMEDPLGYGGAP